jgi:hypothetical protein
MAGDCCCTGSAAALDHANKAEKNTNAKLCHLIKHLTSSITVIDSNQLASVRLHSTDSKLPNNSAKA